MKKSKLDSPHIKAEVIKRIAVGESQSRIAGDVGLHRSQVSRFARREDIKPFIEQEQLKLLEAVPDAVENLTGLVGDEEHPGQGNQEVGDCLQSLLGRTQDCGDRARPPGPADRAYLQRSTGFPESNYRRTPWKNSRRNN